MARTPIGWTLATAGSASPPSAEPVALAMSPNSEPAKSALTRISALPLLNLPQELGESGLPPPSASQPLGYSQDHRPSGELNLTNSFGAGTEPPQPATAITVKSAQTV